MLKVLLHRHRNLRLSASKAVVILALITLAGCANLIKAGSINEVHASFQKQDYQNTLTLITRAEHLNELTPELVAELTYLKARSLEELGHSSEAIALYGYLKSQHTNSQYASLANLRLENTEGN